MNNVPSPATVALRYAKRQTRGSADDMARTLQVAFPGVAQLSERFGLDLLLSFERWLAAFNVHGVDLLISTSATRFELAKWICEAVIKREPRLPLLAFLVVEERLRVDTTGIAGYLRSSGTSLEAVYLQLTERLGEAYLDAAFDTTWKRRAVFNRTLDAAGAYLGYVRQAAELSGVSTQRSIQTRLGISTVLAARFGPVKEPALRDAHQILLRAHEQGAEHAFTYYLEASNWLYDLFDDQQAIRDAAGRLKTSDYVDPARALSVAHLWLRLAGIATPQGRERFIEKGLSALSDWPISDFDAMRKEEHAAKILLTAMLKSLKRQAQHGYRHLDTREILFPFGIRRPDMVMPVSFHKALPELIQALDASDLSSDYVFRDLRAGLRSFLARSQTSSQDDAVSALKEAIQLREGRPGYAKPLKRPDIEIELAEDRFLLAELTKSPENRRVGVRELLKFASATTASPRHLTVLAREIDEHGPLRGAALDGPADLVLAIQTGDTKTLFEAAAREAYNSADLTQVRLGGRSGAVTLRDSDGLAGQTFVFKQTSPEARERDRYFTSLVRRELLARTDLDQRFGLIEHLAELEPLDVANSADQVVSVRRYTNGTILGDFLQFQPLAAVTNLLTDTAEFLAFIHWAGIEGRDQFGARRELRAKEFGRWLRSLVVDEEDRDSLFNAWWDVMGEAPLLPRRDAHPMNWIVDTSGRIFAVDLESTGTRPFGYEIAQLIEDAQVFDPADWEVRRQIMLSYSSAWYRFSGINITKHDSLRYYDAGVLARAARAISNPTSSTQEKTYAGRLFESVSHHSNDDKVKSIASELSRRWRELTGNVGEEDIEALSDVERRRISRAMSHHLRHDKSAPTTKDGWMHVDELVTLLRSSGHKVTSRQLILIAGALGEPRFEMEDGSDIRAVYGHSTRTEIEYSKKRAPEVLYHATPLRNLASIFEARAGLLRGKRNWVHLTDSCAVALNAARRQQAPVAVLEIDTSKVDGLVHASDTTWLAPSIAVDCLKLVPIRVVQHLTASSPARY